MPLFRRRQSSFQRQIDGDLLEAITEANSAPNPQEAAKAFASAARIWPSASIVWSGAANAHLHTGDYLSARANLAIALALSPDEPTIYQQLALVLWSEGMVEAAEAVLAVGWTKQQACRGNAVRREDYFLLPAGLPRRLSKEEQSE